MPYKVVETSIVTDDVLERIVNEWVEKGWSLDGIHFVVKESSQRPSMAFIFFVREEATHTPPGDEGRI